MQNLGLFEQVKFLSVGRKISGRDMVKIVKDVNIMKNYYGMSIRQNCNDLFPVRKSVNGTLIHNINFNRKYKYKPAIDIAQKIQIIALNIRNKF